MNYKRLDRQIDEQDEEEIARYLEQRYKENDYADYADIAAGEQLHDAQ
jgi:DNA-binding phage protein